MSRTAREALRADGRQVPAPADDRARRHQLDGRPFGPEPRAAARRRSSSTTAARSPRSGTTSSEFFFEADERYRAGRRRPGELHRPRHVGRPGVLRRDVRELGGLGRATLVDARRDHRRPAADDEPAGHRQRHRGVRRPLVLRRLGRRLEPLLYTDPLGNALSRRHPWNKQTLPQPGRPRRRAASTRGRRRRAGTATSMETGADARLWITALADKMPHRGLPGADRVAACASACPQAASAGWSSSSGTSRTTWNAFERNRARAYALVQATLVAYENLLIGVRPRAHRRARRRGSSPLQDPGRPRHRRGLLGRGARLRQPPRRDRSRG